jgi:hypothetical protein
MRGLFVAADAGPHPEGHLEAILNLVLQQHDHVAHVQHPRDLTMDGLDQPGLVELACDGLRQLVEHRELLDPPLVVAEQPRVLQRDSRLAGDGLHEALLVL